MGDLKYIFTSFDGRIGRQQFWISSIMLVVAVVITSFLLLPLVGFGVMMMGAEAGSAGLDADATLYLMKRSGWASLFVFLVFVYPSAALCIKRRHDRGSSGRDIWIYYALAIVMYLAQATGFGYSMQQFNGLVFPGPNNVLMIVSGLLGLMGLYLLVVMGFLKGDEDANDYGPNPRNATE